MDGWANTKLTQTQQGWLQVNQLFRGSLAFLCQYMLIFYFKMFLFIMLNLNSAISVLIWKPSMGDS